MGLTKQYLRYNPVAQFGVVASPRSNVVILKMRNTISRYVAVGAVENVIIWDMRTGEKVLVLQGDKHEVSCLATSPDQQHLSVGYSDGTIRIFSLVTGEEIILFSGHRSAVSCLTYKDDMLLASGSHDTDIVIWDLVNESGLYRLKGHKGPITQCHFLKHRNMLISSSKDTFIKWWDLDTQHCFKTMVGHRAEVWNFILSLDETRLISGSGDSELRFWDIKFIEQLNNISEPPDTKLRKIPEDKENYFIGENEQNEDIFEEREVICAKLGSVMRKSQDRVVNLKLSTDGRFIACHGKGKVVEIYRLSTSAELEMKMKKKRKRARKNKKKKEGCNETVEMDVDDKDLQVERTVDDELVYVDSFKFANKPSSIDIITTNSDGDFSVIGLLQSNELEMYQAVFVKSGPEFSSSKRLSLIGHRTESRSSCFTSDGFGLLTASSDTAKLWNRNSQKCIRSMACSHSKCCLFVPGDRQVILGNQEGAIEVYDIASGDLLESIDGHNGGVSCSIVFPNKRGLATGGADKKVKFWEFDLISDKNYSANTKRLTLVQTRRLELDEQVLAIEFSPNELFIAVSLLDCTVKVFYLDTLKFFLSLYSHSLPVGSVSISSDSSLIVTGSADRSVKIWGLDFGDCHRSLFAHDDDVTSVKFVPDTHLFFSSGKDGLIKQWDADKFILIQILRAHVGSIWSMSITNDGDYLATTGRDRSLRIWQRSQEIVLPDEEREQEREEEDEKLLVRSKEPVVPGEAESSEVGMASRTTIESVKATERIVEAIDLYREEAQREEEYYASQSSSDEQKKMKYVSQHPILKAYNNIPASRWVLMVLRKIRSSELEESLLVLSFSYVPDLLRLLNQFVKKNREVELVCRCIFFLMRIHHGRITSNQILVDILDELRTNTEKNLQQMRDTIGFNKAALGHMRRQMELKNDVKFFVDATHQYREKKKKKRNRSEMQRAILTL